MRTVILRSALAAAATLLALSPCQAAAQAAPAAVQQQDKALALAELITSADYILPLVMRAGKQALFAGIRSEAQGAALLAKAPGLGDAVWRAVEPEFQRGFLDALPGYRADVAALYRARLTASELDGLHAFFTGPTGRKLLAEMYRAMDPAPIVADVVKSDGNVSPATIRKMETAASAEAAQSMTEADQPAILALTKTVSLEKLQSVNAEVRKVGEAFLARRDPEFEARLSATALQAMAAYMKEHPLKED